jgi:hypothetical protein
MSKLLFSFYSFLLPHKLRDASRNASIFADHSFQGVSGGEWNEASEASDMP